MFDRQFNFSGLKQLGWLIGRNETNWTGSDSPKPVRGSTASSSKVSVTRTTSRPRRTSTTPTLLKETTPNEAQGLIIDMVKGLVASAQDSGDKNNKNKKKRGNLDDWYQL